MMWLEPVSIFIGTVVVVGGGYWGIAAKVTRLIDEVKANTREARKLRRLHRMQDGRLDRIEKRVDRLETRRR